MNTQPRTLPKNEKKTSLFILAKHEIQKMSSINFDRISRYVDSYLSVRHESETDKQEVKEMYTKKFNEIFQVS